MTWAVWLTGPPASGKSTLAKALRERLGDLGVRPVVLESDALRRILTPDATYRPEERDRFYREVADLAALIAGQGVPVVVDATAPRRAHRDRLRESAARMVEVLVEAPLSVRERRDPKGLYALAHQGHAPHLPGATDSYEAPENPDLVVSGTAPSEESARTVMALLERRGFVTPG